MNTFEVEFMGIYTGSDKNYKEAHVAGLRG